MFLGAFMHTSADITGHDYNLAMCKLYMFSQTDCSEKETAEDWLN